MANDRYGACLLFYCMVSVDYRRWSDSRPCWGVSMFMRRLGFVLVGLSGIVGQAKAHDAVATGREAPLGGNDRRGLANPASLPPPFGSTLFGNSGGALPDATRATSQPTPMPQTRMNYDPGYLIQP